MGAKFTVFLFVSLFLFHIASAQPESPVAYLLQNEQLSEINLSTGERTTRIDLTPLSAIRSEDATQIDRRLWAADIDPAGRYLYQIEAWGHSTNRQILGAPTGAELVRIELKSNTREVILANNTVFNFVISPDGEKILIFFYGDEYLYSTQLACILILDDGMCRPLNFEYVSASGFWLNKDSFIIGTNDNNPLHLIDSQTGEQKIISISDEWYIYWGCSIPESNSLIMSVVPQELSDGLSPVRFMMYEVNTTNTNLLPYTALTNGGYTTVNNFLVSPDKKYLLYKGESTALVDFETGGLIQEFSTVHSANWVGDSTLIIQGQLTDEPVSIMRIDAASGQIESIVSGEAATGLLLFP